MAAYEARFVTLWEFTSLHQDKVGGWRKGIEMSLLFPATKPEISMARWATRIEYGLFLFSSPRKLMWINNLPSISVKRTWL